MTFISICVALYDYHPQGDNELAIQEGELIYVLEKSTEDDWWKAKKRAPGEEEEEPVGLIPNNYVQEAPPTHHAKALYDYARQTDEEVSFSEEARLDVFDTSDPDWTLVGLDGEYGFAPANYIEVTGEAARHSSEPTLPPQKPDLGHAVEQLPTPTSPERPSTGPAATLASVMQFQNSSRSSSTPRPVDSPPANVTLPPRRPQYTPDDSEEDQPTPPAPSLPQRPQSEQMPSPPTQYATARSPEPPGVMLSPPYNRVVSQNRGDGDSQLSPGGFHLYNINEMVSAIGKKKKLPTTLGLNMATGTIMIAPEKSRDGPQQEWTAEKLTHYSIEGKHVFMELVRPSKSVDFHAGAKDTAQEIVAGLGEIAGAARAEGLREILEISEGGGGQKKGQILYDFMAQGEDEVTVAVGDEVVVLDDNKSEEWWMVRRLKNGKEGVVPSSYVEITGKTAPLPSSSGLNAARATVDQNRLEEERLAKEAVKGTRKRGGSDPKSSEVGPGLKLPTRGSSLTSGIDGNTASSQRSKRDSKAEKSSSKSKPDSKKTRTWTDRSGSFKVEAQFIGLKDGKIHLHKLNGVKIAVPVAKMAIEDLEYVEKVTGQSLDDDKPLSDIRRKSMQAAKENGKKTQTSSSQSSRAPAAVQKTGVSIDSSKQDQAQPKGSEYDWFDFFLKAGVNPYQCERYAFNFNKDSMDEAILPDITASVLRTLGLKEGDVLRVMKYLDTKFNRNKSKLRNVSSSVDEDDGEAPLSPSDTGGGLFSGPGGTLRNNTRKGRPAPPVQSNDVVDAESLKQRSNERKATPSESVTTPLASAPPPPRKDSVKFDDDAWDVKPAKQLQRAEQAAPQEAPKSVPTAPPPTLTGSMAELSLLTPPLQPTPAPRPVAPQSQAQQQPQQQSAQQILGQQSSEIKQPVGIQPQQTGANPDFFSQLSQQPTGMHNQNQQQQLTSAPSMPTYDSQVNFQQQQQQPQIQNMPPRQRPQVPQSQASQQSSFLPPPPRPLSAPQNVSQYNNFGPPPLQPQLTGFQASNNLPQLAPPGQSLNDINQMRQQQANQQQMYPQQTGFAQQGQAYGNFHGGIQPQQTGYGQQLQSPQQLNFQNPQQPFINGQQMGSPFADPRPQQQIGGFQALVSQPTGFQQQFQSPLQPQQTSSINSILPPALQPQNTGVNGFGGRPGFGQPPPPVPPMPSMPSQPAAAPLIPQKTGPAPPVKFGVQPVNKLMPQPTGRKANLSQATPQNPFGF